MYLQGRPALRRKYLLQELNSTETMDRNIKGIFMEFLH